MTNLFQTYDCKVDTKGRLLVPSGLKKELTPVLNEGFVIKKNVFHQCLELYPRNEWDKQMEIIGGLNPFNPKHADFIRRYTDGVKTVELDNNSRLLIPKDLIGFAGITKEIVLSAQLNKIEIWDKTKYQEFINDESVDIGTLTAEVMGGVNNTNE